MKYLAIALRILLVFMIVIAFVQGFLATTRDDDECICPCGMLPEGSRPQDITPS